MSKQNKIKHRFGDEKGAMHSRKEGKITVWEWE